MRGLSGPAAKTEAVRLAELHDVTLKHIYRLTATERGGKRKPRSDKGRRTFELVEGTDTWAAAQLVIADKLDPEQALQTVVLRNPEAALPSLAYFRRILSESGLGKNQRRTGRRGHRRFEAEHPGEMFQIDCTALKVRWKDEKTRRVLAIEGVDKNHPMADDSKLRVWQLMLIDDHSRRRFLRYVATRSITSLDVVRFECEAYSFLGVPKILYTDNGSEFKGRHANAEKLLNTFLKDLGGYRHQTHAPRNPQATGKVEVAHRWAEMMDRFVGLAVTEWQTVSIEDLNTFADRICEHYNSKRHRTTKQTPMDRWHATRVVVRKIAPEVIESALLSDEFESVLDAAMTVAHKGVIYKVPGVVPFVNFVGQKVKIVVPPSIGLILMTLPDGAEYEIEKVLATADKAGEFRSTADSNAATLTKRLRETRKEEVRAIRAKNKLTGVVAPVPHYNVKIDIPATNVSRFPQPEHVVAADEVSKVIALPTIAAAAQSFSCSKEGWPKSGVVPNYDGKPFGYWEAVNEFAARFATKNEAKEFMLDLFDGMDGTMLSGEIEAAIRSAHAAVQSTQLRRVS